MNPDELVWSHVKRTGVARNPLRAGEKLEIRIEQQLRDIQKNRRLVRSFFQAPDVAYIWDSLVTGKRGLKNDLKSPEDAESIRDAKGWLGIRLLKGRYHVITNQPAFTTLFDMDRAHAANRSMRKMTAAVAAAL